MESPPPTPERGDLYRLSFRGAQSELRGPHYAVVVSDQPYNRLSTVVVVPFSSHAPPASFHPEATINGLRACALVEQVRAFSRASLGEPLGSFAGTPLMDEIDEQMRDLLGLTT